MDRQDCESCRSAYAPSAWDTADDKRRKEKGPPCKACKPEIHPLNLPSIEIYHMCSDDWNYTMNGISGLRAEAIKAALDISGIVEDRDEIFKNVKKIGREIAYARSRDSIR